MKDDKIQILLTNDDGIASPGLWAAAEALSTIGYVHVVAPREQASGAGRSLPSTSDGVIHPETMTVGGKEWTVYAVGGTPAQAVLHGVLEILPRRPDLVVSGINYGENVGTGVTISGTVGAALEAAALGVPGLAISLQTDPRFHLSYSRAVDFSAAKQFTALFARLMLVNHLPEDVDVLKVDVPSDATPETPWVITRLARHRYYEPLPPHRTSWEERAALRYHTPISLEGLPEDSDIVTLVVRRMVSVTPLSLDLTARVDLKELEALLSKQPT